MAARYVLHVDLDEFIAAVEVLRRPELTGRPVVVGGTGDPSLRGVVATASYAARAFGVRSGIPLRTALRRCPDAVFLPSDPPAYFAASDQVMTVLRESGAIVEVYGWDEAFLEIHDDDPESFALALQNAVWTRTRLSCSVGIGDNKLRAKLASGFASPAMVYRLTRENWREVMDSRPPGDLWGIGPKTARKLAGRLGIRTVYDLAVADPDALAAEFGPTIGPWLGRIGRGVDPSPVSADPWVARSHSREETFQRDVGDPAELREHVARLTAEVLAGLSDGRPGFRADLRPIERIAVKVRFVPFDTHTQSVLLAAPTRDLGALTEAALAALAKFTLTRKVRLLGVRADFAAAPSPEVR
ncbi:MAG: dinB2 [Actinomycetia bacterium]|nr:dinB2 [Actinomycetes bacterium]